jgi:mannose-6-phosphate isomerase
LASLLSVPLPGDGPIGEAWVLSDRTDHQSQIANGPLKGQRLGQVMKQFPESLMGKLSSRFTHFPLLLKFLDAHEMFSVQVHPSDAHPDLIREGDTAKTEAWVVIDAAKGSQIYAGLKSATTAGSLKESLLDGTIADHLVSISPKPGDAVFIPGGTVHTLGDDVVVFEVQQNSDTTFRLYDWGHIDPETNEPRALQVDEALACIEFGGAMPALYLPVSKPHHLSNARGFSIAAPFSCGGCLGKTASPLEQQESRACWLGLKDQARSCRMAYTHRWLRCVAIGKLVHLKQMA